MPARKNGPAWFYPGHGLERQPAAITFVHSTNLVDLWVKGHGPEQDVAYFDTTHALGMEWRHAHMPHPEDNVDVDAVLADRDEARKIPGDAPSDNGNDDGA